MVHIQRLILILGLVGLVVGPVAAAPMLASPPSIQDGHDAPASSWPAPLRALLALSGVALGITIKKDIGSIAQKFVTRASAAAGDYKTGVQGAGQKWEQNTASAEGNYDQGVQAAITNKRFGRGVVGKSGKYQTNAVNLGSARYAGGVQNAQDAYARGMAPVLAALSSINLPSKGFRGSPQNQQRSNMVATALAALRSGQ